MQSSLILKPSRAFIKEKINIYFIFQFHKRFGDWALVWSLDIYTPLYQLIYLQEPDVIVGWTHNVSAPVSIFSLSVSSVRYHYDVESISHISG